jgi:hypothetical protein
VATNKNILDSILQTPGSLASKAFQGVANTAKNEEGKTGDVSRYVISKLESNTDNLEKLDKPYRQGVARPISTFLQTVKDLGRDGLDPRETWNRSWERSRYVTPGQAAVGLVGAIASPTNKLIGSGPVGTEKINWSNQAEVQAYFEKDNTAAERVSGGIDAVTMFFLDPLVLVGKGVKLARLAGMGVRGTEVKGPVKFGRTNLSQLVDELDQAKAGKKNAASVVVDSIEKNAGDFTKLESLPIVANSQNPVAVARAFSEAAETSGRNGIIEVIKVGLGDDAALTRIQQQDSVLGEALTELKGEVSSINKQIRSKTIKNSTDDRPTLNIKEIENLEATKEKLVATLDMADTKLGALRSAVTPEAEGGIVGKIGSELAWSRRKHIEQLRAKGAEINGRGWFTEYDALVDPAMARAMHKVSVEDLAKIAGDVSPGLSSETAFRVLRTVGYFGRNYKAREVPAGSVTIAGEVGDYANKEFRARLIAAAPEAGFSAQKQKEYYNEFSKFTTDSERFQFLEKFEQDALTATVKRKFNTDGLNQKQLAVLNDVLANMSSRIFGSKQKQLKEIINDKNYVYVDPRSGKELIFKEVVEAVETLAKKLADQAGKPLTPDSTYHKQAKDMLSGIALTRTQVPNIHFGVDFNAISNVISDEGIFVSGLIKTIKDYPEVTAQNIKKLMDETWQNNEAGAIKQGKEAVTESWHAFIKPGYESIQNNIWKPAVLLSLRYTSRNVLDGWFRVAGSFADMVSHNGYSLNTLLSGAFDPSVITAPIRSGARRTKQRVKAKGLVGFGGARAMEQRALAEKIENEVVFGRTFGINPEDTGDVIVDKISKRYKDEGEHFAKEAEDVLSTSIRMASDEFSAFGKYRGNPESTKLARSIAKIEKTIFEVKDSSGISKPFLEAMSQGDFELAYQIAVQTTDPSIINATLESITNNTKSALESINKLVRGKAIAKTPKLKAHIERLQEVLALVKDNSDVAKMAFDSDRRINILSDYNKQLAVSRAPAEKIVAYSEGRVDIGYGATIEAPYAKTMRRETMSAANSTSRAVLNARWGTFTSLFSQGKKEVAVRPNDEVWSGAHAEFVTNILYGDDAGKFIVDLSVTPRSLDNRHVAAEVARMKKDKASQEEIDAYLKSNYSDDDIKNSLLDWIKGPESRTWRKEKEIDLYDYRETLTNAQWSDITDGILGEINRYLPTEGPSGESLDFLRQALEDPNKTFDDTLSARIPMGSRHAVFVNTEIGGAKRVNVIYKNLIGNLFHMLATLPEDHLVRHPFYNAVYRAEGERLARQFAKQKGPDGKNIDVSTRVKEIQNAAHAAAHKAVVDRLYTIERHTNVGHMFRFFEPFYMAKQNTTKFWVGNVVRNPEVAVRMVQMYSIPYKLGAVYDREDNYKVVNRVGKLNHPWNQKGLVMQFNYPKWMVDNFFAGDSRAKMDVSLQGFDVQFQGQPLGLPQISSPLGAFFLGNLVRQTTGKSYDPAKFLEKHGIADFDRLVEYVQPYYESTRGAGLGEQIAGTMGGSVALESLLVAMGGTLGQFDNPVNGQKFNNRFDAIRADKLSRLAEMNVPIDGQTIERIYEESATLAIKSFYAEAFLNGLPIVTTSRYRTLYETVGEAKLRGYRAEFGYELGTAKFVEELDSIQANYITGLISDSTVDNRYGFNSSEATLDVIYNNKKLLETADKMIADTSLIGTLFNQGDFVEDRSDIASDVLYNIRVNGKPVKYTSDDAFNVAEDQQIRAGNKDYFGGIEVIEQHARDRKINKGTKAYDEYYGVWKDNWESTINERYPIWAAREQKIRQNRVEKNLAAASVIVTDAKYMETFGKDNPVALAVAEYLRGRVKLQAKLAEAIAISGNTTIDAKNNAYVAEMRDEYVKALDARYPGFQRVHEIYFNNDKLQDISIYQNVYGFGETE